MAREDVITQAPHPGTEERPEINAVAELPDVATLSLHGRQFRVKRDRLLSLPEGLLFGLSAGMSAAPFGAAADAHDNQAMEVDFNPDCFEYIVRTLDEADRDIKPLPITNFKAPKPSDDSPEFREDEFIDEDDSESVESLPWLPLAPNEIPNVLKSRPSLIVLREDLEYYVLSDAALQVQELWDLKDHVGDRIANDIQNRRIFNGLRNCEALDSPEYHLMQMLVLAGLPADKQWDFRDRGHRTSQVLSLQISPVRLPLTTDIQEPVYALQKLLLFWRKPAKKCWWGKTEVDGVTVHVRRVWTLELSILGLTLQ